MFHRLLMALLIACLALPAAAMPAHGPAMQHDHVAMAGMHHAPTDGTERHGAPAAQHDCIGCIAPISGIGAATDERVAPAQQPRPALYAVLVAIRAGPETPPPRS